MTESDQSTRETFFEELDDHHEVLKNRFTIIVPISIILTYVLMELNRARPRTEGGGAFDPG